MVIVDPGTVAVGAIEAEYIALSEIVQEVLFLRQIQELMIPELKSYPLPIMEGNQVVFNLANKKHGSRRTRYIDIKHHIVRDIEERGKVVVSYAETRDQHADVLSKLLDRKAFANHAGTLTMKS